MAHDAHPTREPALPTDALTGVQKRPAFDSALDDHWRRHLDRSTCLGLILMDIDSLKPLNATLGWVAGDRCLRDVAHTIRAAVQSPGSLVARYQSGVFAAILPETDSSGATAIGRGIVDSLRTRALPHPSSPAGPLVTLSVGIATLVPGRDLAPHALIDRAARGLEMAKAEGRNRIAHLPL